MHMNRPPMHCTSLRFPANVNQAALSLTVYPDQTQTPSKCLWLTVCRDLAQPLLTRYLIESLVIVYCIISTTSHRTVSTYPGKRMHGLQLRCFPWLDGVLKSLSTLSIYQSRGSCRLLLQTLFDFVSISWFCPRDVYSNHFPSNCALMSLFSSGSCQL